MTKNSNIWVAIIGLALVAVFGFAVPGWKNHLPIVGTNNSNTNQETSTPISISGSETSTSQIAPIMTAPKSKPNPTSKTIETPSLSPAQNTITKSTSNLLTVTYQGGTCPGNQICSTLKTILRDGSYFVNGIRSYRLNPTAAENLLKQIDTANFANIKSKPFSGECPTKTGGQELIYVFYSSNGQITTVSSCQTAIDYSSPLFAAVKSLLPPF